MLTGHLDSITSSGYLEGWACDSANLARPCRVSVHDSRGIEVARGVAHRYRKGLAFTDLRTDWCAFRIRSLTPVKQLRAALLTLREAQSGAELHCTSNVHFYDDFDPLVTSADAVVNDDPTILSDITQLSGCHELFHRFIKTHGVSAFVRTAYVYVLGRSADQTGQALYGSLIRRGDLHPYELLAILSDSDEYRSRVRTLGAPNTPTFPFHCD